MENPLLHNWTVHTSKSGKVWHVHNGDMGQVVSDKSDPEGYLWVFKDISSHSASVGMAKSIIETLAESGNKYKQTAVEIC